MNSSVQRLSRFFSGLFAVGAGLSMLSVFLIVFVNSTRRYTIGKSFEWGEEMPVYLAIYGIMFGVAKAYMEDRHIRFTILIGFLTKNLTRKLYMLVDLLMISTGGLLAYSGYMFTIKRGAIEASGLVNLVQDLKSVTGWDWILVFGQLYPWQAAMIFGGTMLAIAALLKFLLRLSEEKASDQAKGV
jgi:TRAP-type transport system small permease protein